jgi:hypothetical protein
MRITNFYGKGFGLGMMWLIIIFCLFIFPGPASAQELELVGKFETPILSKNANRTHNIKLAIARVNDYIIEPNQTFSYNQVVGPRSKERGYQIADIIVSGKVLKDYGGGVCQLSSTIYQAALAAELKVTEAHRHSAPVKYIGKNMDATVSYGFRDLKFKNTQENSILLSAMTDGRKVTVAVYALKEEKTVPFYIDGEMMSLKHKAILKDQAIYVHFKDLVEDQGLGVYVEDKSGQVGWQTEQGPVILTPGKQKALVNGREVLLTKAPYIQDQQLYVPIRFMGDMLGWQLNYNQQTNILWITTPAGMRLNEMQPTPLPNEDEPPDNIVP